MIKVSVMYPHEAGARFDHDYYRDSHMPLVQRPLGRGCSACAIDRGVSGGEAGSPPIYVAMCQIFTESLETFQAAMAGSGARILADVANGTDLQPVVQISDVVVGPAGLYLPEILNQGL